MPQTQAASSEVQGNRFSKFCAVLYGVVAYLIFLATILYAIGFVSGLGVPRTINSGPASPAPRAFGGDLLLLTVFAVQHSVMARKSFKRWWTRYVPEAVERSTYVLISSLTLDLLFWQWRPVPALVWHVDAPGIAAAITALSFGGWVIAFLSTFLINHFELFGLQQVTSNLVGQDLPAPRFRTPFYYRFVRHPLYLGFVIAFWATPTMTVGQLLFAAVTTAYIFIGIALEERDLVALFGEQYLEYRKRVSMLFPWRRSR